jgi:Zn-dependent M28 family amino/carboxypeptidase
MRRDPGWWRHAPPVPAAGVERDPGWWRHAPDVLAAGVVRLLVPVLLSIIMIVAVPASGQTRGGQDGDPRQGALRQIRAEGIRAHLAFLADDLLEGRAAGSRGGGIAAHYIAAQLRHAGLEPVRGSYFQQVPITGWRADPRRTSLQFSAGARQVALRVPDDAILWLGGAVDSATVSAELVFVGYGVRAPEYQWDDFKDRDVRGRILVVLASDPPAPPGQPLIFEGGAMSYYGRWTYKVEEAARQGAAGVLIVHTTETAGYPWTVVETSFGGERLDLAPQPGAPQPPILQGWLTLDAARRIFAAADLNLDALYVRAARRDFQPVAAGISARITAVGTLRRFDSPNVVGLLHGRHPTRRNEYVVYTAHHDGLGVGPAVGGDSIYNGAYDNASGVAVLLEIARAFAFLPEPPDRSVLFLFPTAEEAGLVGSRWFVRHPLVPLQRMVAALNIDGANLWGETSDVSAIGLERSTLGLVFEAQAATLGLRVSGERAPHKGLYFRSDHFPFARGGVPALFIDHGSDFRNRPAGWGEAVLTQFERERYHLPGDAYHSAMDLAGALQQTRHTFLVGYEVASAPALPRWYEGGAFLGGRSAATGSSGGQ